MPSQNDDADQAMNMVSKIFTDMMRLPENASAEDARQRCLAIIAMLARAAESSLEMMTANEQDQEVSPSEMVIAAIGAGLAVISRCMVSIVVPGGAVADTPDGEGSDAR